ncbi:tetraprenyl-beta-curcumene synthase family protein [Fictibacillus iocasae]|uniref:Tetraprenyl-beta-curcumene synthase family protein n=1 Tax=Fictibacillus iocasae TaxID=2715437 RepID=A0ABW2NWG5_9BACL
MSVPTHPIALMYTVYKRIFPAVHSCLNEWQRKAECIPDPELRRQALASICSKTFHCEGGAILALPAGRFQDQAIQFIVAYQTISDYLDNLCDRSTSLDDKDFSALHESMEDALTPGAPARNYYRFRDEQEDGGYLHKLVSCCQGVLQNLCGYEKIAGSLLELASIYCDLQIHKHVIKQERETRLKKWFDAHKAGLPQMSWYEFSACAGSTLGIFSLVSYAFCEGFTEKHASQIKTGYFPWVQGLHILLDYFIDQDEDRIEGDLNFCSYYSSKEEMLERLTYFITQADKSLAVLPHSRFHRLIHRGLLGIYLSDQKVKECPAVKKAASKLVRLGGTVSLFFYMNRRIYQKLKPSY